MSDATKVRISPTPTTRVEVTIAGALMKVDVEAIGLDRDSGGAAARLRLIAHALERYADKLAPLWIEEGAPAGEPQP